MLVSKQVTKVPPATQETSMTTGELGSVESKLIHLNVLLNF